MADGSRIPRSILPFNIFIDATDSRLQLINPTTSNPYYVDYGLTEVTATSWSAQRKDWDENVYAAYINPLTSTSVAKDNVQNFMAGFREFAQPQLNKIAVSDVAGTEEEHIFNLVLHRKNATHPTTAIDAQCVGSLHSLGRGSYEVSCRDETTQGRSHKVAGADSVQYAYLLSDEPPTTDPTPDDGTMTLSLATTVLFALDFGAASQGQWLTIYFRWYNTKHPAFAGPWSAISQVAIG
jgi:hypothetical protein